MIVPPPPLRTIVAGSRGVTDLTAVAGACESCGWPISEVVSGAARGVDRLGEQWARLHGISVRQFPAEWEKHGKSAGRLRNTAMAYYADALIAVWDGQSVGTRHMIDEALRIGLRRVLVVRA